MTARQQPSESPVPGTNPRRRRLVPASAHLVRRLAARFAALGLVVSLGGVGGLGGCGGTPAPAAPANPALEASPVVLGGDNGLEVQYWVAAGGPGEMWAAFAEFRSTPVPVDAGALQMLQENGLRVLAVPVDRLPEVQRRLAVIGAVQRQWLGQAPSWVDAAAGPLREGGQTIALHDGRLRLGPGRLRLLLRGWTLPAPAASEEARGAALHLEMVPQHQESRPTTGGLGDALRPQPRAPEDEGVLFTRMALTARLKGDLALVLVPETPGVEWKEPPPPEPEPEPAPAPAPAAPPIGRVSRVDPAASAPASPPPPAPVHAADATAEVGPPGVALPSLGEAMLMSRTESRTVRAVVVLVPRVPQRFDLLGR